MSNLVDHAKRELGLLGEEPEVVEKLVQIVEIFASMGHSGSSSEQASAILDRLLHSQNLTPLTDNPEEWQFFSEEVWGSPGGIWQNQRHSEAFSPDGGKTYWLLKEGPEVFRRSKKFEEVVSKENQDL